MHIIKKILNNNAVIVYDCNNDIELLVMDKGVGFGKKIDTPFDMNSAINVYYLDKKEEKELLDNVSTEVLETCNEILIKVKEKFGEEIDTDILLPLSDHIQFAMKRIDNEIKIYNPFSSDIRVMFPEEYSIAKQAKILIKERLGYDFNDDEVCYITLHIHSALSEDTVSKSLAKTSMIQESINIIEESLDITINYESTVYVRLINHLKYLIVRVENDEVLDMELDSYIQKKFPEAFKIGEKIVNYFEQKLNCQISRAEIDYLSIHIQRILLSHKK